MILTEYNTVYHVDEAKRDEEAEVVKDPQDVVSAAEAHREAEEEVHKAYEVPSLLRRELPSKKCRVDSLEKVDRGFNDAYLHNC